MQTGLQFIPAQNAFYYFDDKGYMKTGKMSSVEEENDSFTYYFQTKNGGNGKGINGENSGYLYWNGKRLEADDDFEDGRESTKKKEDERRKEIKKGERGKEG